MRRARTRPTSRRRRRSLSRRRARQAPCARQDLEVVAVKRRPPAGDPAPTPALPPPPVRSSRPADCASGLAAAGQYRPFCRPGSLRKVAGIEAGGVCHRVRCGRTAAARRRRSGRSGSRPARCARSGGRALLPSPRRYRIASRSRPSQEARETAISSLPMTSTLPVVPWSTSSPPLGGGDREDLAIPARRRRIGRVDEVLTVRPEDCDDFLQSSRFGRLDQRAHRVLRRRERSIAGAAARLHDRSADSTRTDHGQSARRSSTHGLDFTGAVLRRRASCSCCADRASWPRVPTFPLE